MTEGRKFNIITCWGKLQKKSLGFLFPSVPFSKNYLLAVKTCNSLTFLFILVNQKKTHLTLKCLWKPGQGVLILYWLVCSAMHSLGLVNLTFNCFCIMFTVLKCKPKTLLFCPFIQSASYICAFWGDIQSLGYLHYLQNLPNRASDAHLQTVHVS